MPNSTADTSQPLDYEFMAFEHGPDVFGLRDAPDGLPITIEIEALAPASKITLTGKLKRFTTPDVDSVLLYSRMTGSFAGPAAAPSSEAIFARFADALAAPLACADTPITSAIFSTKP